MVRIVAITVAYETDVRGELQPVLIGLAELREHCRAERIEDLLEDLEMLVEDDRLTYCATRDCDESCGLEVYVVRMENGRRPVAPRVMIRSDLSAA